MAENENNKGFPFKTDVRPEEIIAAFRRRVSEELEKSRPIIEVLIEEAVDAAERVQFKELAYLVDPEFAEACRTDLVCKKTWLRIVKLTNKLNRQVAMEAARELAGMLSRMGVGVVCSDRTCWMVYKTFTVSLRTIARILNETAEQRE